MEKNRGLNLLHSLFLILHSEIIAFNSIDCYNVDGFPLASIVLNCKFLASLQPINVIARDYRAPSHAKIPNFSAWERTSLDSVPEANQNLKQRRCCAVNVFLIF
jgi:hypothetical protein